MKIYLAPMEGITGHVVRNAFYHHFSGIDRFFTPFIAAGPGISKKDQRQIDRENNAVEDLVPQAISTNLEDLAAFERRLAERGYREYNLNFGCPSGTVVSKGRGAGFLRDPAEIDRFLDRLFSITSMRISIKTRIGIDSTEHWKDILNVYMRYPLSELIVHPRLQKDLYKGHPRMDAWEEAYAMAAEQNNVPIVYNGDIVSIEDYQRIVETYPKTAAVMIGRGLLMRPGLAEGIRTGRMPDLHDPEYRGKIIAFHDEIYEGYAAIFSGEKDVCMHMKEIWSYLRYSFEGSEKEMKKLLKTKTPEEYKLCVKNITSGH